MNQRKQPIEFECSGFYYRLNSLEYQNLQDKVRGPIQNIENIHIYKSVTERFIEVFREEVEKNPRATVNEVRVF